MEPNKRSWLLSNNSKRSECAAKAYLKPIMDRSNLTTLTETHINKILTENNRAIGVECIDKNKQSFQLKASKEVLLSSGAFGSPQILLRSGIGPSDEITKHGIKHILELPGVGKNLQDHIDYLTVHKYNSIGLIGFSLKALLFKYPLRF